METLDLSGASWADGFYGLDFDGGRGFIWEAGGNVDGASFRVKDFDELEADA